MHDTQTLSVPQSVVKRDGRIVPFDIQRIQHALERAMAESGCNELMIPRNARRLSDRVVQLLAERFPQSEDASESIPTVEQIQDIVIEALKKWGDYRTMYQYILYREKRKNVREARTILFDSEFEARLTPNAMAVLEARYLIRDAQNQVVETPSMLFRRVANNLAEAERAYAAEDKADEVVRAVAGSFYRMLVNGEFLPNSPCLMNAGRKLQQLAACFVLPVPDSIEGIFEAVKLQAIVQQSGGGTGFAFSRLRPKGARVASTDGTASGPISFMQNFNQATNSIAQGGKRRGANMGILRVDHPDILDFITCKGELDPVHRREYETYVQDLRKVSDLPNIERRVDELTAAIETVSGEARRIIAEQLAHLLEERRVKESEVFSLADTRRRLLLEQQVANFNISVAVTDAFMKAVDEGTTYDLIDPHTKQVVAKKNAREVFDLMVKMAWQNGEPGVVFIDRINALHPAKNVGEIESTNPCGEVPLMPNESCNLGSINLGRMVKNGEMDWERLRRVARLATRFLDNVIDQSNYPSAGITEMTRRTRKLGLGVMGFADMLIKLGVSYDSTEAVEWAEKVMAFIESESVAMSQELAEERGVYPAWEGSDWWKRGRKMRNATTTCIAPTGTISIIANASSGIEPIFALAYSRHVLNGAVLTEVNPLFEYEAAKYGYRDTSYDALLERIVDNGGSAKDLDDIPDALRGLFPIANDISVEQHIRIQAAFQKFTHNATSKTINGPFEATVEDVAHTYRLAYQLGCKGVTYYRNGSRFAEVLKTDKTAKKQGVSNSVNSQSVRDGVETARTAESKPEKPLATAKLFTLQPFPTASTNGGSAGETKSDASKLKQAADEVGLDEETLRVQLGDTKGCLTCKI